MGAILSFLFSIGAIVAFFWSLDALRTLKDGQAEIVKRLKNLEAAAGVAEHERFTP